MPKVKDVTLTEQIRKIFYSLLEHNGIQENYLQLYNSYNQNILNIAIVCEVDTSLILEIINTFPYLAICGMMDGNPVENTGVLPIDQIIVLGRNDNIVNEQIIPKLFIIYPTKLFGKTINNAEDIISITKDEEYLQSMLQGGSYSKKNIVIRRLSYLYRNYKKLMQESEQYHKTLSLEIKRLIISNTNKYERDHKEILDKLQQNQMLSNQVLQEEITAAKQAETAQARKSREKEKKARKKQEKIEAATVIQKNFKRHHQQQHYQQQRDSATVIQKNFRRYRKQSLARRGINPNAIPFVPPIRLPDDDDVAFPWRNDTTYRLTNFGQKKQLNQLNIDLKRVKGLNL
jgi:hypothetical protein